MKKTIFILISSILLIVILYSCYNEINQEQQQTNPPQNISDFQKYDSESWKAIIPASCKRFFDGCNDCQRIEGSTVVGCTKKGCSEYSKPKCLDSGIDEKDPRCDWEAGQCEALIKEGYYYIESNNKCVYSLHGQSGCSNPPFKTLGECVENCGKNEIHNGIELRNECQVNDDCVQRCDPSGCWNKEDASKIIVDCRFYQYSDCTCKNNVCVPIE